MKRLIATIILAVIAMTIAGCDFTYEHYGHGHHHGPGPIVVVRPPVYGHGPHGYPRPYGPPPGRHGRGH